MVADKPTGIRIEVEHRAESNLHAVDVDSVGGEVLLHFADKFTPEWNFFGKRCRSVR